MADFAMKINLMADSSATRVPVMPGGQYGMPFELERLSESVSIVSDASTPSNGGK